MTHGRNGKKIQRQHIQDVTIVLEGGVDFTWWDSAQNATLIEGQREYVADKNIRMPAFAGDLKTEREITWPDDMDPAQDHLPVKETIVMTFTAKAV